MRAPARPEVSQEEGRDALRAPATHPWAHPPSPTRTKRSEERVLNGHHRPEPPQAPNDIAVAKLKELCN